VQRTGNPNAHFVDPRASFKGHEICGSLKPWINDIALHVSTAEEASYGSFHPNKEGQAAYARIVGTKVKEVVR